MVKVTDQLLEMEREGEDELTLVAVRYTGDRSLFTDRATQTQGGWPSTAPFVGRTDGPGPWQTALLPSRRLGWWERNANFEVAYETETLAEAFLEKNYLDPEVFGAGYDPEIRDRVHDALGIDVQRNAEAYREDLAEVAGISREEAGEETDPGESESPFDEFRRTSLQTAVQQYDHDFNTGNAANTDLITFLEEREDEDQALEYCRRAEAGDL